MAKNSPHSPWGVAALSSVSSLPSLSPAVTALRPAHAAISACAWAYRCRRLASLTPSVTRVSAVIISSCFIGQNVVDD
nr:MAG TPA: hypothetical protein [Bacteriophage sp.]